MRILLRNKIPFFSHLTVSWSLPVARIIFLKSSQIQSGGFTNLLCKSVKCLERIKSALQRKRSGILLRGSLPKSGPLDFATKNTFPLFFVGGEALVGVY